jgi:transcriptional regulator with XRE-family HTH domain
MRQSDQPTWGVEYSSPEDAAARIAANIRAERARKRLTQTAVAAVMQLHGFRWHQQTVAQVERGERSVKAEELLGLAAAYMVSAETLLD